jgi:molybdate transport system substrate-binding protein
MRAVAGLTVVLALTVAGCGKSARTTVLVRGGPSLLRVLEEVGPAFEAEHPDVSIVTDFSCPPCVLPATEGASAKMDVLVSVGDMDIKSLAKRGTIDPGQPATFGTARLALVAPKRGRVQLRGLGDLLTEPVHKVGIGDPEQTDLGHYTQLALQRAGILNELQAKVVVAKSGCDLLKSVALVLYDAAIVYDFCIAADNSSAESVEVLSTRLYDPIPMYVVANRASEVSPQAQEFVDFVASPAARPYLERKGIKADTGQ